LFLHATVSALVCIAESYPVRDDKAMPLDEIHENGSEWREDKTKAEWNKKMNEVDEEDRLGCSVGPDVHLNSSTDCLFGCF
jgi:hypothetical protein